jgi:prepilin-type N-terminal cleavage/methylation domain-containing protein
MISLVLFKLKNSYFNKRGFTLVELLVVISIIGVLSSTVFASLGSTRTKARDARRMSDIKNIQTALELYKDTFGEYPRAVPSGSYTEKYARSTQSSGNGTNNFAWYNVRQSLLPYISLPLDSVNNSTYYYIYDSDAGDNYQSYGLSVNFENTSNNSRESSDGGYDNSRYEVGPQPTYCTTNYTGANANWITGTDVNDYPVCVGTPIP